MKTDSHKNPSNNSFTGFLLYTTPDGKVKVEIYKKAQLLPFWKQLPMTAKNY